LFDGPGHPYNSTLDNAYTPPQESIQEIRFITNSFSAEYGRSAGGVIAAAGKSGANQLHGSVYDYLKNEQTQCQQLGQQPEQRVTRPAAAQRNTGLRYPAGVRPRVYDGRNKTFFFFNWEQINDHGVSTPTANVPTALQKSGDFSQTFTSANALIKIYDPLTPWRTRRRAAVTAGRYSRTMSFRRTHRSDQ